MVYLYTGTFAEAHLEPSRTCTKKLFCFNVSFCLIVYKYHVHCTNIVAYNIFIIIYLYYITFVIEYVLLMICLLIVAIVVYSIFLCTLISHVYFCKYYLGITPN